MRVLALLILVAISGCSRSDAPPQPTTTSTAKDPATARTLIGSGATILDVRTRDEFAGGHVPGAVNLPVQELSSRLAEVEKLVGGDRGRPIVVYCGSGARSGKAKVQLEAAGYKHVVNGGGLDDLK